MDLVSRISDVITAIGLAIKGKQDTLVSGTNIATINSQSLLAGGNIVISGGGGSGTLNVYIQESEPMVGTGEKVLWIQTNADGRTSVFIKEGE